MIAAHIVFISLIALVPLVVFRKMKDTTAFKQWRWFSAGLFALLAIYLYVNWDVSWV